MGPAAALRGHDVEVVADLPGVGANLSDRPLGLAFFSAGRDMPAGVDNHIEVIGVTRTDPSLAFPDVQLLFMDVALALSGGQGYAIGFSAIAPHSCGSVRLLSADPSTAPAIDPALLSDERDLEMMLTALLMARDINSAEPMNPWRGRQAIPGSAVDNPDHLRAFLKERGATTYFHPVGTCSMGSTEASVTDTRLRIHGAEGPRVVDASVMPSIPAANPHPTVLAVAERAADMIRTQHG